MARAGALEARDEERRQRAQRLLSRQLPQLKAETMFLRRRSHLRSTTIRNCLFTLFRTKITSWQRPLRAWRESRPRLPGWRLHVQERRDQRQLHAPHLPPEPARYPSSHRCRIYLGLVRALELGSGSRCGGRSAATAPAALLRRRHRSASCHRHRGGWDWPRDRADTSPNPSGPRAPPHGAPRCPPCC